MANFSSVHTIHASNPQPASNGLPESGDALVLLAALASAATTKAARKQYRKAMRKLAWSSLKAKFNFKNDLNGTIAGLPTWAFIVIAVAAAAIGIWLFGLLGFLIVLGLAVIIYLLVNKK